MKAIIVTVLAVIVTVAYLASMPTATANTAIVAEPATAISTYEFETKDGNVFAVDDVLSIGAEYIVTFDTKTTITRTDDEIVAFHIQ